MVEGKRRDTLASAGEAVGARQQRRVRRAAEIFLQRHPDLSRLQLRFDAMLLTPRRLPRHLKDAWQADIMLPSRGRYLPVTWPPAPVFPKPRHDPPRQEERRTGKECGTTCRTCCRPTT